MLIKVTPTLSDGRLMIVLPLSSGGFKNCAMSWPMLASLDRFLHARASCSGWVVSQRRVVIHAVGGGDYGRRGQTKPCGAILASANPVGVDCVATTLMGFNWSKLRELKSAFTMCEMNLVPFQADAIRVLFNQTKWIDKVAQMFKVMSSDPYPSRATKLEKKATALTA